MKVVRVLACAIFLFSLTIVCSTNNSFADEDDNCRPSLRVVFSEDGLTVVVYSSKDLSNVVLKYCDGSEDVKYEGLRGKEMTFSGGGKVLAGIWVKSGCNKSGDGPGYGEFFPSDECIEPTPTPTPNPSPTPTPKPKYIKICYIPSGSSAVGEQRWVTKQELRLMDPDDYTFGECPEDCMGIPGGRATVDVCGVCGGDSSTCKDCAGEPNGDAVLDECGVCEGDDSSCVGCDGVPNSGKVIDVCGVCEGDSSSCKDCADIPNGDTKVDECGVCGGDNSSCLDCEGVPNGDKRIDVCGICGGDGSTCPEITDCEGKIDLCGVCNGNNDCLDCAGIPNGGTEVDCCGVCGGDGDSCEELCETYNLRRVKKKSYRHMRKLKKTVKEYSLRELNCGGSDDAVKARLKLARKRYKANKKILSSFIEDTVKVCDTEFCTKTSFKSVLKTVRRNTKKLYKLSKEAQYGSISACGSTGSSANSSSQSSFNRAVDSLSRIPNQRCD